MDLIRSIRAWAGFDLDQLCANCRQPFYNRDAMPVCYGCQRDTARVSILAVLNARLSDITKSYDYVSGYPIELYEKLGLQRPSDITKRGKIMNERTRDKLTFELTELFEGMAEEYCTVVGLEPKDAVVALWTALGSISGQYGKVDVDQSYTDIVTAGKPLYAVGFQLGKRKAGA